MKTPKEKARELYDKMNVIHYMQLHSQKKDSKGLPISMYDDQIKQCALVSVTDTIEALKLLLKSGLNNDFDILALRGDYMEIKKEIELL